MKQYSTATQTLAPSEAEAAAATASSTNKKGQAHNVTPNIAGGSSAGVLGTWTNLGPGNVGGRTRARHRSDERKHHVRGRSGRRQHLVAD